MKKNRKQEQDRVICARCGTDVEQRFLAAVADEVSQWNCTCGCGYVTSTSKLIQDPALRERTYQEHVSKALVVESELRRRARADARNLLATAEAGGPAGRVLLDALEQANSIEGWAGRTNIDVYALTLVLELAGAGSH